MRKDGKVVDKNCDHIEKELLNESYRERVLGYLLY